MFGAVVLGTWVLGAAEVGATVPGTAVLGALELEFGEADPHPACKTKILNPNRNFIFNFKRLPSKAGI
jgi:hypothetical protein